MLEFDLDGRNFRAEKLPAMKQWHLLRKISPLFPPLAPIFQRIAATKGVGINFLEVAELAHPFMNAIAEMKASDSDEVFHTTLSSVKVETAPATWMPLWNTAGITAVMELNDIGKLLPIILKVVQYNLGDFISGFLTNHGEPSAELSGDTSQGARTG